METTFIRSLEEAVKRHNATDRVQICTSGPFDVVVKVPPQSLILDRAARHVKTWLAQSDRPGGKASSAVK